MTRIDTVVAYASATPVVSPQLLRIARRMIVLSVLSGPCVIVCFSPAVFGQLLGGALHVLIFAVTIYQAILTGLALQRLTEESTTSTRNLADGIALAGLSLFAIAPLFLTGDWKERPAFMVTMTVVFACLSTTSWRHVPLYRLLANYCSACGLRHMARAMLILGWFKTVFESGWLLCCLATAILLSLQPLGLRKHDVEDIAIVPAFGALFGCVGFMGVWLWMIIAHVMLLNRLTFASQATRTQSAFSVITPDELPIASPALSPDRHVEILHH